MECYAYSKATLYETNFTWVIDHVSFLQGVIESPSYKTDLPKRSIEWKLTLQPINMISPRFIIPKIMINLVISPETEAKCMVSFSSKEPKQKIEPNGYVLNEIVPKYLKNDALTIYCVIQFCGDRTTISCPFVGDIKIQDSFRTYFLNPKLSDVLLVAEEEVIPAHSQILAMRSSVFETLLFEKKSSEIKRFVLQNVSVRILTEML